MDDIRVYKSFDEAIADMQRAEAVANARATPEQRTITYGDHWKRIWTAYGERLVIYGYILTREEQEQGERDAGADEAELRLTMDMMDGSHARGYRFSRAYSVVEPEGELGDTHVSVIRPINTAHFEAAKAVGWDEPCAECGRGRHELPPCGWFVPRTD